MKISLIAAVAENGVIGINNDLPWHLPDDFAYFKNKIAHHPVIMGRKSLEALGRPFPEQDNIVVTRNLNFQGEGIIVASTFDDALHEATKANQSETFVIGGAKIYAMALSVATTLYLTEIHKSYDGDTYFPSYDKSDWQEISRISHPADEHHETGFDFVVYQKRHY